MAIILTVLSTAYVMEGSVGRMFVGPREEIGGGSAEKLLLYKRIYML